MLRWRGGRKGVNPGALIGQSQRMGMGSNKHVMRDALSQRFGARLPLARPLKDVTSFINFLLWAPANVTPQDFASGSVSLRKAFTGGQWLVHMVWVGFNSACVGATATPVRCSRLQVKVTSLQSFHDHHMSNRQNYCNTNLVFDAPWPFRGCIKPS